MPKRSKAATAPFRAWDTEGVGQGRRHRTVCLVTDQGAVVSDPRGLSSRRLVGALWRTLAAERNYLHVSFAFGYDVAMMLKDVPRGALATLWADGKARWGPYRLTYRPRRAFAVYRRGPDGRTTGGQVWDVFGFFQCSLLKALDRHGVGDPATRDLLARMKARRGSFRAAELPALIEYSRLENVALVALMNDVRQSALDAGLPLNRWDGAGAVASALLTREGVKAHLPPRPVPVTADPWPQAVRTGARFAYFGGRIETGQIGHHAGPVHRYDIRSAYPAILATLPAGGGRWERRPPVLAILAKAPRVGLLKIRWRFPDGARWYPFPWRARDGAVTFPREGAGWYWTPEIEAAWATFPGCVQIEDYYCYIPPSTARPWAWIRDVYNLRAEWKAAGVGAEKILKLGLNSLYGKLAQTLGGDEFQCPGWHCLEWAGYVTSRTRAHLFRTAVAAGDAAVAIATDALFTTRALRGRELTATDRGRAVGGGLGQWEHTVADSGTWVQSGVYWTGSGEEESAYHRGFSPATLHRADVLAAWRRGARALAVPETRFQGVGASVGSASAFQRRAQWTTADRTLSLIPYAGQKRYSVVSPRALARGLTWTTPRQPVAAESWDGAGMSAPVALPWAPDGIAPPDTRASDETSED